MITLKEHKEKTGKTYEQLAEEFHVSRRTMARWLSGDAKTPWWALKIINQS